MENISNILIAYQNEINSPEILPYKNLTFSMREQKEKITKAQGVIKTIYEQDYERINFFITQYLKARLSKLSSKTDRSCLSSHEKAFNDAYDLQNETRQGCYVCFYCVNNVSALLDNNVIDMKEGDCFVGLWDEVKNLVVDGDAVLF